MAQDRREPDALTSRFWASEGTHYSFPEQEAGGASQGLKTGLCFSGGGTRALSAALGQLRGLTQLGLMDKIGYISCVSGGSWASTAYTYYAAGPADDEAFLGPVIDPKDLTRESLGRLAEECLGYTATRSLRDALFKLIEAGVEEDRLWIEAVGQVYFQPFGLYDSRHPAYFSLDSKTVDEIRRRNPVLAGASFHTVRSGAPRPFLVINSTLIGPASLAPFKKESVVGFQYTPLYVGNPFALNVTYEPEKGSGQTLLTGGGFIEPFAFGGQAPVRAPSDGLITLPVPARTYSLADASGTSSSAYAGFVEQRHFFDRLVTFKRLAPVELYWPVTPTGDQQARRMVFGDGGVQENYGLIPLLQRKLDTLVVFVNTSTPLSPTYNPERAPRGSDIDAYLPALFGYVIDSPGTSTVHNQVFAKADFAGVVRGLQQAKQAGKAVITISRLNIVPNQWWGVKGGRSVRICWVYNERVRQWESQLPADIQRSIEQGNHHAFPRGPFKHFPHYKTVGEDGLLDLVELSAEQVNLLAHLSCWNITANAETFKQLLEA